MNSSGRLETLVRLCCRDLVLSRPRTTMYIVLACRFNTFIVSRLLLSNVALALGLHVAVHVFLMTTFTRHDEHAKQTGVVFSFVWYLALVLAASVSRCLHVIIGVLWRIRQYC